MIEIYNYSVIPAQLPANPTTSALSACLGTDAEKLMEFGARICYKSLEKAGHSPDFIEQRVKEGHADIVEHGWVTLEVYESPAYASLLPRHKYLTTISEEWGRFSYVCGNLRAWGDWFSDAVGHPYAERYEALLSAVSPKLFMRKEENRELPPILVTPKVTQIDEGVQRVTLVGYPNVLPLSDPWLIENMGWATFYIEGVSRSLTHQLVRHRTFSISQESQRYVDLEKGSWEVIIPPAIAKHPDIVTRYLEITQSANEFYRELRASGVQKQDARYLLPNATETRLLVSAPLSAWSHFLELREAKDAQWEIRELANKIRTLLAELTHIYGNRGEFERGKESQRVLTVG